jgi:polysaccharide chain length determinant protein (PEP-CTERM system associated)
LVPGRHYTPSLVGRLLWQRRWMILVPLVLTITGAGILAYRLPNLYLAETTILLIPQRVPESYVKSTVTEPLQDRLRTIGQQILSRTRLEQIITEYKLYPVQSKTMLMEQLVEYMRLQIGLTIVKEDSFRISFTYPDPELAAKVTERLASLFIDENLRDREVQADSTSRFLEAQLNDARRRLIEQEKRLEEYRHVHSGSLPTQMGANLQMIQSTQLQIAALDAATNRMRDRRIVVDRMVEEQQATIESTPATIPLPTAPVAIPNAPVLQGTPAQRLEAARQNLAALQQHLKPEHPDVQRAMRQVRDLEGEVNRQEAARRENAPTTAAPAPMVVNQAGVAARNRLSEYRSERLSLDQQIAHNQEESARLQDIVKEYQGRLEQLPTRESELTELTRDYATLQAGYQSLLAKREDSVVAANLERRQIGEQFRVLDPARVPQLPASPNRPLFFIIGAVLGLALGLGSAVLREFMDTTLRTDEELGAGLGLATLAVVPLVRSVAEIEAGRRRARRTGIAAVASLLLAASAAAWWIFGTGR